MLCETQPNYSEIIESIIDISLYIGGGDTLGTALRRLESHITSVRQALSAPSSSFLRVSL